MSLLRSIGLLGGTFNPIHKGHLYLAEQLTRTLGLDEVRFIPSAMPVLKAAPEGSAAQRAEMVKCAIAGKADFKLDSLELARTGKSYTIDSLLALRATMGNEASLCWLIGTDAFKGLPTWHRWSELLDYCHFVVVQRPDSLGVNAAVDVAPALQTLIQQHITHDAQDLKRLPHGKILMQEIHALDISSTHIRQQLAVGGDVSAQLPVEVLAFIKQHHLYEAS
jgi:nicotinate-nucleotide adenylyltransferase